MIKNHLLNVNASDRFHLHDQLGCQRFVINHLKKNETVRGTNLLIRMMKP